MRLSMRLRTSASTVLHMVPVNPGGHFFQMIQKEIKYLYFFNCFLIIHFLLGAATSNPAISGAAGAAPKVRIGRRLADLFIQSGKADVSSFRTWINGKQDLREELEALLYSKKWKELVEESIELVAEDFRILTWMEIINLNEKYVDYPDSSIYDIDTSLMWFSKILSFNNVNEEAFIRNVSSIMDKKDMKVNSLWLFGSTNSGKSLLCNSIVESAKFFANIIEFDERTAFPLNDAPGKRVFFY